MHVVENLLYQFDCKDFGVFTYMEQQGTRWPVNFLAFNKGDFPT